MDTFNTNNGTPFADRAADKAHDEFRDVRRATKDAVSSTANKVDSVVGQAKDTVQQGINTFKNAAQQTRDSLSGYSEDMITYTRENPVKALMLAALSGAMVWTLLKAVAPSRD